jgi:hypothetical protein
MRKREAWLGGKMRKLFKATSKLPRSRQEKIAAVIEAFVNQHSECKPRAEDGAGAVAAPNYCGGSPARRNGFQINRAPTPRPFVSRRAEGNPDPQFSFSYFFF